MTGEALRAALGRLNWTRERLAGAAGLGEATVYRMLAQSGEIQARRSSLDKVAAVLRAAGALEQSPPFVEDDPLITVDLAPHHLRRLPESFHVLKRLSSISVETRDHDEIFERMGQLSTRMSSAYIGPENDLLFTSIGRGIRWGGHNSIGRRVLDVGDREVGISAATRYWRCLLTGEPVLAYVRRSTLEFLVITVPARLHGRQALVTASAIGRPDPS